MIARRKDYRACKNYYNNENKQSIQSIYVD